MAIMDLFTSLQTIVNERFAKDVRQAIHDGVYRANQVADENKDLVDQVSIRQDAVEDFNTQVIQEMTDKDIISAPEIIQARDGEQTLQDRLKRTDEKINQTTLDVMNGTVKVIAGESITTNGFYEFGNTYRYKVLQIVPGDIFLETNKGFLITDNGEIKISSELKIVPEDTKTLYLGSLGCNDNYDDVCFTAALNLAKQRQCNIEVDVDVTIDSTIDVYRSRAYREVPVIEFYGSGVISKHTSGPLFNNTLFRTAGGLKFNDIHFMSTEGAGTSIYDAGMMVQMYFTGCSFTNLDHLVISPTTEGHDYIQSLRVELCTFVGGNGWIIETTSAYDFSFVHNIVEERRGSGVFKIDSCIGVRITDNLIEGVHGKVLEVTRGRSLTFHSNHMEWIGFSINDSPIVINNTNYDIHTPMNLSFQNNMFAANSEQSQSSDFYFFTINYFWSSIAIKNNYSNHNLLRVIHKPSLTMQPNKLVEVYTNMVAYTRNAFNDNRAPKALTIGAGNITNVFKRPLTLSNFIIHNSEANDAGIASGPLVVECAVGKSSNKIGFQINGITLEETTQYAWGISADIKDGGSHAKDEIHVVMKRSDNGNVVAQDVINVKDGALTSRLMTFYNMDPFVNSGGRITVNVEVYILPKSGSFPSTAHQALIVSNLVIQRGYVATDFIG